MKKQFNKQFLIFMIVALIAVLVLTGCEKTNAPPTLSDNNNLATESILDAGSHDVSIGEGSTAFPFEVTDDAGNVTRFTVNTDQKTVGEALISFGLIEGDESDFGLFVKTVNGITADFDTDKAYWAFYVDGEYALTGIESTNIETDKTYAFVYTKE